MNQNENMAIYPRSRTTELPVTAGIKNNQPLKEVCGPNVIYAQQQHSEPEYTKQWMPTQHWT